MAGSASPNARKHADFSKLMMAGYEVDMPSGSTLDFFVKFFAPSDSPYSGGIYRIHVELPEEYPFKSPAIGFCNKIFHPNIDERSGTVCLDVINQTWTPLYSLVNIFEVFLPQLLTYPNASDPLNPDAASLYMKDRTAYETKIKDYLRLYANDESSIFGNSDTVCTPKRSSNSEKSVSGRMYPISDCNSDDENDQSAEASPAQKPRLILSVKLDSGESDPLDMECDEEGSLKKGGMEMEDDLLDSLIPDF